MHREDLAWAAGLFEGEGCFYVKQHKNKPGAYPFATMKMTDEDVVRHFHQVIDIGSVRSCGIPKGGKKPQWRWETGSFETFQATVAFLWPWLKSRRRAKVTEILTTYHTETARRAINPDGQRKRRLRFAVQ